MPSEFYFGDDAVIQTFTEEDGSTSLTFAKAKSALARAEAEHEELFAPGSVTRQEVMRREIAVIVEFEAVQFNEDIAQYWLDGQGTSSTTITDDVHVQTYQATLLSPMTDHTGATSDEFLKAVVSGIHFPDMPLINLAEGEYSRKSLTGRGSAVTFTKETGALPA